MEQIATLVLKTIKISLQTLVVKKLHNDLTLLPYQTEKKSHNSCGCVLKLVKASSKEKMLFCQK